MLGMHVLLQCLMLMEILSGDRCLKLGWERKEEEGEEEEEEEEEEDGWG